MEANEAQIALDQIRQATEQTRRAVARSGIGWIFIIWGCVWFVGFLGSQILSGARAGVLWGVLDILGGVATAMVGIRTGRRVRSANAWRVPGLWLALMAYVGLLLWIAGPMPADRLILFITVGISFGFVFLGLWLAPALLWTGMALTALAILGWLVMPAYLG
ncbi:MAG: hypothetical protein NTU91_01460, partial [Chloroflexi bacterium]|nr:hypothetical protein [Chloroflexota bacterium]